MPLLPCLPSLSPSVITLALDNPGGDVLEATAAVGLARGLVCPLWRDGMPTHVLAWQKVSLIFFPTLRVQRRHDICTPVRFVKCVCVCVSGHSDRREIKRVRAQGQEERERETEGE